MNEQQLKEAIEHSLVMVAVTHPEPFFPGARIQEMIVRVNGCKKCMLVALTMALVKDEKFRELINQAGRDAKKIRRGEMDLPSFDAHKN